MDRIELSRIKKDEVRIALGTIYQDPTFIEDLIVANQPTPADSEGKTK